MKRGASGYPTGSDMRSNGVGDALASHELSPIATTTNATPTDMLDSGQPMTIPASTTWAVTGSVSARQLSGAAGTVGDSAGWMIKAVVKRDAANNTTLVGVASVASIAADAAAGAWTVVVDVDNATEALKVTVTGEINKTIKWSAHLEVAHSEA